MRTKKTTISLQESILSISLVIAALIISGSVFLAGNEIGGKMSGFASAIEGIQLNAGSAAGNGGGSSENEQEKFREFHDRIFENQSDLGEVTYKAWAAELGMDEEQFESCYDSEKYSSEVDKDLTDGTSAGVSGTPTLFIGKRNSTPQKIVGAQPYPVFEQAIESILG